MKKNHFFIPIILIFGMISFAATHYAAISWNINKSHTSITFEAKHFFTSVPGAFEQYEATIYFDPENLEESSIDVQIDVTSINTKNARRDGHLQSEDFFQSDLYPHITFKSEKIVTIDKNNFEAHGTLSIRRYRDIMTVEEGSTWRRIMSRRGLFGKRLMSKRSMVDDYIKELKFWIKKNNLRFNISVYSQI